jgi:hypothetical protein
MRRKSGKKMGGRRQNKSSKTHHKKGMKKMWGGVVPVTLKPYAIEIAEELTKDNKNMKDIIITPTKVYIKPIDYGIDLILSNNEVEYHVGPVRLPATHDSQDSSGSQESVSSMVSDGGYPDLTRETTYDLHIGNGDWLMKLEYEGIGGILGEPEAGFMIFKLITARS